MMKAISFSFLPNFIILLGQFIQVTDANWITGNLCWSMPCLNGGSCFGSAYTYLCVCPINYSGPLCEKRLGICQENPCGNRGLCVETGVTSFECRCYFDYMGPLCEEHVPKDDPTVWSSLIPVHTRVLLDFLQEAYRAKAQPKSSSIPNDLSVQQVFLPTSTIPTSISTTTMIIDEETTPQSFTRDTTEPEHVIRAENIQLEKIFPEISTASTSVTEMLSSTTTAPLISSPTMESNETVEVFNETTIATTTIIASTETVLLTTTVTEDHPKTNLMETTVGPITLASTMEYVTNATESSTTTTTATLMDNVMNTTEYDRLMTNITLSITDEPSTTFEPTTIPPSTEITSPHMNSTEISSSTSSLTTESPVPVEDLLHALNKSENLRNRLLYKLCRQLLSQIFPNASLSSINSTESAMSLTSNSSLMMNHTATALLSWIQEQLNSTSTTTLTTTTTTSIPTTTTTATTTTTISTTETTTVIETTTPVIASPLIQGRKLGSVSSLQRINMDEALAWANESIDGEH